MPTKPQPYPVLSVDWDFFFREDPLDDWGHRESGIFLNMIWLPRAADIYRRGSDPLKTHGVQGRPVRFWKDLGARGYRVEKRTALGIGESHASAYHFLEGKKNLHIVNVDAHHDLGYHGPVQRGSEIECGNWVGHLIAEGRVRRVTQVYPEWRKAENVDWRDECGEQARKAGRTRDRLRDRERPRPPARGVPRRLYRP